jgi:hypothetical protein
MKRRSGSSMVEKMTKEVDFENYEFQNETFVILEE